MLADVSFEIVGACASRLNKIFTIEAGAPNTIDYIVIFFKVAEFQFSHCRSIVLQIGISQC